MFGIPHIDQKKGISGHRRTRTAPVFRFYHPAEPFYGELPPPYFDQRAYHRPHHIAQEPVCLNGEYPFIRSRLLPAGIQDAAIVGLHIGMQLAEARKVGILEKHGSGFVHPPEVKRLEHPPRIMPEKRILACRDMILILPISSVKTGMGIVRNPPHTVYRNVGRKQAVEFAHPYSRIRQRIYIRMRHHQAGMHSRIRAPCPHYFYRTAHQGRERFLQLFLHTRPVGLDLPAVIIRAVVS